MATSVLSSNAGNRPFLSCLDNSGQSKGSKQIPTTHLHRDAGVRLEMKGTEDLLASEISRLTVQERSKALDDVHCVGEELKETPEMIQKSLVEFEEAVRKERNPIYESAANQNRSYVEDLRLKFLRANLHNVGRSVRQMMNFLRYKSFYFGNDKVARDITLDDMNQEDKELMLSGLFHVQHGRDRQGRVVIYLFNTLLGRCKAETLVS